MTTIPSTITSIVPEGANGWVSTSETDVEGDGCSDFDTDEDGFVDNATTAQARQTLDKKTLMVIPLAMRAIG